MAILVICFVIILVVVYNFLYFILPSLSPIPFFPTNKKDLSLIIKTLLPTTSCQSPTTNLIVDLGAGTGTVIFPAAYQTFQQKLKTKFTAIEIHPLLILIMHLRRLFHPNKKNIKIVRNDIFKINYLSLITNHQPPITNCQPSTTLYLYVGPFVIERLKQKLIQLPKNTAIISYMYKIPEWENKLLEVKKGVNNLFIYQL